MPVLYPHYSHSRYSAKRRWKKLDLILDSVPRHVQGHVPVKQLHCNVNRATLGPQSKLL